MPRRARWLRAITQGSPQSLAVNSVTGKRAATGGSASGSAVSTAAPVSRLTSTTRPSLGEGGRSV